MPLTLIPCGISASAAGLRDADHGSLACAIRGDQCLATAPRLGGEVDDLAPASLLHHLPGHGLQGEVKTLGVHGEDAIVGGLADLQKRSDLDDTGVVDPGYRFRLRARPPAAPGSRSTRASPRPQAPQRRRAQPGRRPALPPVQRHRRCTPGRLPLHSASRSQDRCPVRRP